MTSFFNMRWVTLFALIAFLVYIEVGPLHAFIICAVVAMREQLRFNDGCEHALEVFAAMSDEEVAHVREVMNNPESE